MTKKLPAIDKLEPTVHVSTGNKTYVSLRLPKLERWENGWKLEGTESSDPAFGMWATLDGALDYIRQMGEKIEETFQAEKKSGS